ncbi:MAG: hypothetical protein M3Q48_11730, partial [Actinomycetota bacterium]|nr:hypothetical protein [Actinomycetota bacterium]
MQGGVLLDVPVTPQWGSVPWVGVVWPDERVPGGWARSTLAPGPHRRGYVAAQWTTGPDGRRHTTALFSPGDVIEFGADYTRRRGRRRTETVPVRWYGVVLATHPERLVAWGPFPDQGQAWDVAQQAMATWREAVQVHVPGITDGPPPEMHPPPDPSRELPGPVVEVQTAGETTRVDDPTHGTVVVDAAAFGAGMAATSQNLVELLGAVAPDVELRGDEPVATLAALAARHAPERLAAGPLHGSTPGPAAYHAGASGEVVRRDPVAGDSALRPPRRWTPDGFGWGHDAETAWELAYALVADATGSPDAARCLAPRYATDVLA